MFLYDVCTMHRSGAMKCKPSISKDGLLQNTIMCKLKYDLN